ncbi:hypothetical protein HOD20_09110 [archaeon]|nr:hypothetical protein [archaeon]
MKNKRGASISLYVFMGLIILISTIFFLNAQKKSKLSGIESEAREAYNLDAEAQVLKQVVDGCIEGEYAELRDSPGQGGLYKPSFLTVVKEGIYNCIEETIRPYYVERNIIFNNPEPDKFKITSNAQNLPPNELGLPDLEQIDRLTFSVDYSDNPLTLNFEGKSSDDDGKSVQLNEFVYEYNLNNKVKIKNLKPTSHSDGRECVKTTEELKKPISDSNTLVIPKNTMICYEEGDPFTLDSLDFDVRLIDSVETTGTQRQAVGGGIGIKFGNIDERIEFEPKIHFIQELSESAKLNMLNRRKQYSCFMTDQRFKEDIDNMDDRISKFLVNEMGINPEYFPKPTYGDTENDQIVCYIDVIEKEAELAFYQDSCIKILNAHLDDCNVNSPLEYDRCLCGNDVLEKPTTAQCLTNPPSDYVQCKKTSTEPTVLPCLCDKFVIYCQDVEMLPRTDVPPKQDSIDALDEIESILKSQLLSAPFAEKDNIGKKILGLEAAKFSMNSLSDDQARITVLGVAAGVGISTEKVKNLLLVENKGYDPLVCSARNY